MNMRKTL